MLLLHKDIPVADICIIGNSLVSVKKIYNREHLPVGVYSEFPSVMDSLLSSWQKMRSIPYNRENISDLVSIIGCSIGEATLLCHFLSLTDCYWVKDEQSDLTWKDVNFHEKHFTNKVADKFLFNKNGHCSGADIRIPDYTTDGVLPKIWVNLHDVPHLVKFGGVKAANEVVASKIAKLVGVSHVEYLPFDTGYEVACISPCFVKDANTDFVNLLQIAKEHKIFKLNLYEKLCRDGFEKPVNNMIQFIHLIHNTDCHEKNSGFLRNANTLETLSFAPLFDSGTCLGVDTPIDMKPFVDRREEQRKLTPCDMIFPEKRIIEQIVKETYDTFRLDDSFVKTALADLNNTYEEVERELYSIPER